MDQEIANPGRARAGRRWAQAAGLVAAGVLAGGVVAGTMGASAATSNPSPSPSSGSGGSAAPWAPSTGSTAPGHARHGGGPGDDHASSPVRSDEKPVSTADAAILKAAAIRAVPGGTVYRIETDAGDGEYEAHMTKADGTEVTVKFDKDLGVIGTEDRMGKGDPAPAGAPARTDSAPTEGGTAA